MVHFFELRCVASLFFVIAVADGQPLTTRPDAARNTSGTGGGAGSLSLAHYMQRVVEYNESVQARLLAFHASRSQRRAEAGIFEPAFVTSAEFVDRRRANTVEVERSLRSGGEFKERNQNYSSGLEVMAPLGTRVRLGATGRQLTNNVQRTVFLDLEAEYESSVGLTIEQPLLRGAGTNATLASLRLAARGSEIAYQEYRRHLMQVVADAEMAYWQLYFAQQEAQLTTESLTLAQTLMQDSRINLEAGRGSRLDVLEAEAGMALRRSRESLARQKRIEARNRMVAMFGGFRGERQPDYIAAEPPTVRPVIVVADEAAHSALVMSPDLLRARAQVGQELIRVGYAKNQRLPQLDMKASYAATGLGFDWATSWRDVEKRNFPGWTVGVEMRVPIWGGTRGRNELRAAQLRLTQAERIASDTTTQVRAALETIEMRVDASFTAARNFQAVVEFRSNLLATRLQGRDVGRLDARNVLEAEQELFAARLEQLQSEIEYQRALLDLQIVSGGLLQARGLDLGFTELEQRTSDWTKSGNTAVTALQYHAPTFERLPAAAPILFEGEPDPNYPWRTRLTVPFGRR